MSVLNVLIGLAGVVTLGVVLLDLYLRKKCKYVQRPEAQDGPQYIPYGDPILSMVKGARAILSRDRASTQFVRNLEVCLGADTNGSHAFKAVQANLFGKSMVNIWRPDMVREMLFDKAHTMGKMTFGVVGERVVGKSILNVEGEEWKRQKKIVGPAFQHEHIRVVLPAMTDVADEMIAAIKEEAEEEVSMHSWTRKATVEIIGKAGFGHTFHALKKDGHEDEEGKGCGSGSLSAYEDMSSQLSNPIHIAPWLARMTGAAQKFAKSLDAFDDLLQSLVEEKRAKKEGEEASDLLDMLVNAHYDGDAELALSDTELKHNLSVFFVAGHETSAGAVASAVQFLAENPDVQATAYAEVKEAYEQAADGVLTYEDVCGLSYIKQVIQETLRLAPPAAMAMRVAKEETQLGGYRIAKGTLLLANIQVMHNDPDHWVEPSKFDPDRFSPARKTAIPRCVYAPFSMGPRQCIGNNFAMLEMRVLLAKLILNFAIAPSATSDKWSPYAEIVMRPSPKCKVTLTPRA